ncbi:MAG TPA: DUF5946 family protein [Longimicrobium sp.]|nr:DUF5946 family protein [Longimicrobium sp.]
MDEACPECGAVVPEGGTCRDNFHALLVLEAQVPGAAGALPHFYLVSSYALQHPESMGYTERALADLRTGVGEALDGRAGIPQLRERARRVASGGRVMRKEGDAVPRWRVERWPIIVADVLAGGVEGYAGRVAEWARSIRQALDAAEG